MKEMLTYKTWETSSPAQNGQQDYMEVLKWAYSHYAEADIVYACSFGAEGVVLIDLIYKVNKNARIVFLDTGLHFSETYQLIDEMEKRYPGMRIERAKPAISLQEQEKWYGDELWKTNPTLCCRLRKVTPLRDALSETKAWISGLRREQSPSRQNTMFINKDETFKKIKICPLIHWTWEDIITYIKLNHLPYNPLHDKGYPSIGCEPCTAAVGSGDDFRSGRWLGHAKTECGLHQQDGKQA